MKRIVQTLAVTSIAGLSMAQWTVFAAETVAGSAGGNTAAYGGVQQYNFAANGTFTLGTGLPASSLSDAAGLKYRNGKLYVSNRHGNTTGAGSIKVFDWNGTTLSGGTTIISVSSSPFAGFHGFDVAPNGDIFVTTATGGTRRFRDNGSGYVDIGGLANGSVRDAVVSPDGLKLLVSTVDSRILVTEIQPNAFGATTTFTVDNANTMHQMSLLGRSLYVASFNNGRVHRVDLGPNYMPVASKTVANLNGAIGITCSPKGEMYITGHTTNTVTRFLNQATGWTTNGTIATGKNMGYAAATPLPTMISGSVNLNSYFGSAPGSGTVTLNMSLVNPGNGAVLQGPTPVYVTPVGGMATYNFFVNAGISGSVRLVCTGATWLKRNIATTVGSDQADLILVNGNTNGDGVIDLTDYTTVAVAFNKLFGNAGYVADADFNKDGVIDLTDYTVLAVNFNAVDDPS